MASTTKSRSAPCNFGTVDARIVGPGGQVLSILAEDYQVEYPTLKQTQVTVSESHPSWRKVGNNTHVFKGDLGGEFFSQRRYVSHNSKRIGTMQMNYTAYPEHRFVNQNERAGPYLAYTPPTSYPTANNSSNAALNALGATAIARCKPTKSAADVSNLLGETLIEGLPKLIGASFWKSKTKEARKLASHEFLNVQFGWLPVADDISSIASSLWNADSIMRQYARDSGRLVRRRYEFPPIVSTTSQILQGRTSIFMPGASFGQIGGLGRCVREVTTSKRQWFSGAFTYYMPGRGNALDSMARDALQAKKLLGLSLTPETVWNLTPWSWAVDWFSNAGDVISNLSDWMMDSLCLRYGYLMEHSFVRETYTWTGDNGMDKRVCTYVPPPFSVIVETKIRRKANPFGFGITWNGLSPIQYAITLALGIGRT